MKWHLLSGLAAEATGTGLSGGRSGLGAGDEGPVGLALGRLLSSLCTPPLVVSAIDSPGSLNTPFHGTGMLETLCVCELRHAGLGFACLTALSTAAAQLDLRTPSHLPCPQLQLSEGCRF